MCIVLCEENLYDLVNVLGPFSIILQPLNLYKVEFTYVSSARKTARKATKYFDLSVFN